MATKHTKKELFETLLVFVTAAEAEDWVVKGIEHEIELLSRKHNAAPNPKRVAEQNEVMADIVHVLSCATAPMRATAIAELTDYSVQRVSAMLPKIPNVVRHTEGKVVTFTIERG